ncbi:hypothetical protein [Nocardioides acrostichi]|uniref:hypothetical protein n=1 Tax=Nocardioides acrostichi TaxID=2784339 RepID=UPI001A9C7F87|nr:hypothetical protein [Nocardioides acrostichi]
MAGLTDRVAWNLSPPRLLYPEAALDVALEADSLLDAVAALADACGSRRTTPAHLRRALAGRPRVRRRLWLAGVRDDVAAGTCSVLEREYLSRVERAHGLPSGTRQARIEYGGHTGFADVRYDVAGVVVELDGRLHHSSARARRPGSRA